MISKAKTHNQGLMIRAFNDGYEKGKADAIEEFLKKDKECQERNEECNYMYSEITCIECIAEQLKEQK